MGFEVQSQPDKAPSEPACVKTNSALRRRTISRCGAARSGYLHPTLGFLGNQPNSQSFL